MTPVRANHWTLSRRFALFAAVLLGVVTATTASAAGNGSWTAAGNMTAGRNSHTATLLQNGKVLVASGFTTWPPDISSAELYDPTTGTFTATGSVNTARHSHVAKLLPNGKVLIVGGYAGGTSGMSSAELYDPAAGTFAQTGNMTTGRYQHAATLLNNGKLLVTGGWNNANLSSAELYDPATGTFTATGSINGGRHVHASVLLPSGKVLIVGGQSSQSTVTNTAELYDPATGAFTATGSMSSERGLPTAILLPNGKVLVSGGYNQSSTLLSSAELYDPSTGTFTATGDMSNGKHSHSATLLANGTVLIAGGVNNSATLNIAELYDPATGTFAVEPSMANARNGHQAVLLPNGTVLVVGGWNGSSSLSAAELYTPATALIGGSIQNGGVALGDASSSSAVTVSTIAGSAGAIGTTDGTGSAARFKNPWMVTTDGTSVYVTDHANHIIRKVVIATGEVTTLAGSAGVSGSADGTGSGSRFSSPMGITTDGTNLFVADEGNNIIRRIAIATGAVTTLAGSAGVTGSSDGTGASAQFNYPTGITTDGTNLYVVELLNNTIRKIAISTGVVTTLAGSAGPNGSTDGTGTAARFSGPVGITTDGTNLYVNEAGNYTVRKIVIATGVVTTIAGTAGISGSADGTRTSARFGALYGIATDGTNLYVVDNTEPGQTIRKIVLATGAVTTIAGSPGAIGSTDGAGSAARFSAPVGIATDGTNLYVTDYSNSTVRKISASATAATVVGGWNLLGNGSSGTLNVAAAFGDAAKVNSVWKWNASSAKWAFYAPSLDAQGGTVLADYAASKGYDVLSAINGGEGFWISAKSAFTVSLPSGTAISSASFQTMASGWNLAAIGDSKTASDFNKALSLTPPASGTIPINITTLWAWDAVQIYWYFYAPSLDSTGGLTSYTNSKGYLDFGSKVLGPAIGFWVNKP